MNALTPEQIELLRSLLCDHRYADVYAPYRPTFRLEELGFLATKQDGKGNLHARLTYQGAILLASIDQAVERERQSDAVTIGSRGNEIVVHRPCEGDEWSCDSCHRCDRAVWKYDRYHGGPRVETFRCPDCLFSALEAAANQMKGEGE